MADTTDLQRGGVIAEHPSQSWWESKVSPFFNWKRTSLSILEYLERSILSGLAIAPEGRYVPIYNGAKKIWTVSFNTRSTRTPLVMLHGMGSGVALWVLNFGSLSANRPVYALDVLGFGRSTRPKFSPDADRAEQEFVDSIEEWRKSMKLDQFILLGHSLGGFLAASYGLRHGEHVRHLVLVDPWGFPERPADLEQTQRRELPAWAKVVRVVVQPFNPLAALRVAGPWGPSLVARFRPDLISKYSHMFNDNRIADYLYHCNAQTPSGEAAFKSMTHQFGWAKRPMLHRIQDVGPEVSMTLIHGSRSWVDYGTGYEVKYRRPESFVDVQIVRGAGHHVYADQAGVFNDLVNKTCEMVDREENFVRPSSSQDGIKSDGVVVHPKIHKIIDNPDAIRVNRSSEDIESPALQDIVPPV